MVRLGISKALGCKSLNICQSLEDKFQRYFPEVDTTKDDLTFVRDPFTAEFYTVPLDFQEILQLKNDLLVKDLCKHSTLEKFWSGMLSAYPDVSSYAIR